MPHPQMTFMIKPPAGMPQVLPQQGEVGDTIDRRGALKLVIWSNPHPRPTGGEWGIQLIGALYNHQDRIELPFHTMGKALALTTSVMQQSSTKMDILLITNGRYTPPSATREISTSSQIITMEEIICSCKSAMAYKHLQSSGLYLRGEGGICRKNSCIHP